MHFSVYIFIFLSKKILHFLFALSRNFYYTSYFYQFWYSDIFMTVFSISIKFQDARSLGTWIVTPHIYNIYVYMYTFCQETYTWSSLVRLLIFRAMFKVASSWRSPTMREISTAHISFESFLHFSSSAQIYRRIHAKFLMNRLPLCRGLLIFVFDRSIFIIT